MLTLRQNFQVEGIQKPKKSIYTSCIREKLESHLAFIAFIVSNTINHYCLIKERLKSHIFSNHCQDLETQLFAKQWQAAKSHPASIKSSLFTNVSNIFKFTLLPAKAFAIGNFLQHGYYYHSKIKVLITADHNLYKYI